MTSRRALLVVTISLALSGPAARAAPPPARSHIAFHGWSPDSQLVAYTRERGGRSQAVQRMHRFVRGGSFDGFGRMVGGDVATYARERGYQALPAAQRPVGPTRWVFRVGARELTLEVVVGRDVRWVLHAEDGRELAQHTFDRIYLAFEPELYPAPDGAQAVLVMHLDAGWEIDAAIFPVPL